MCQRYEAEAQLEGLLKNAATIQGWIAHRDGLQRRPPEPEESRHNKKWLDGWDSRNEKFIPWCIESKWRELRTKQTGQYSYETPTVEQADTLF